MKKILIAVAALLSLSQAAHASGVASIDCLATNGVTIKGAGDSEEGIPVVTTWGFFRKDFVASISEATTSKKVVIDLNTKDGTEYSIALDASPYRLSTQKVSGSILQPSTVRGADPVLVAYVRCDLRVW